MVDATRELTTNKTEIESKDAHLNGPEADVRSQECICVLRLSICQENKAIFIYEEKKCQQK